MGGVEWCVSFDFKVLLFTSGLFIQDELREHARLVCCAHAYSARECVEVQGLRHRAQQLRGHVLGAEHGGWHPRPPAGQRRQRQPAPERRSLSLYTYIYIYIYTHVHTHTRVHISHTLIIATMEESRMRSGPSLESEQCGLGRLSSRSRASEGTGKQGIFVFVVSDACV